MTDPIVGIDLGTTHSLVATVDSGIPLVLADAEGRRLTPSVVQYPAEGGPVVGWPAVRARAAAPERTVVSVKRLMGRRWSELRPEDRETPFGVVPGEGDGVWVTPGGRRVAPEDVSAEILRKLKVDAEAYFGVEVRRAVITVPAYFNDGQRQATKRAGEQAGFTVERIVNEPTAAALAYGLDKLKARSKVAVYDLGGGTFDLTILEMREGVFEVLSTNGDTRLGGDDLDRRVATFLAGRIAAAGGPTVSAGDVIFDRLLEAAREAKVVLSDADAHDIRIPFLGDGFHFEHRLTRGALEELTRDIVERTRTHCMRALSDAGLQASDLDQVILVGGQTRMPMVRRLVAAWFGCPDFEEVRGDLRVGEDYHRASGPALNTSQNPDEAVALGAAVQAAILSGGLDRMLLLDVTPLSLGIETFGGLMNVLIPRNTTIPVKAGEMFTNAVEGQREVLIHVLQGERERAADNWTLGRFTLPFGSEGKGRARVGVQFEIDADGILHVLARDIATGSEKVVDIRSAVDVDDEAVQEMVDASVEHAFSDLRVRQWVEARLRAEQTLEAARNGLRTHGERLEASQRGAIDAAVGGVETVLEGEDPETGAGDPAALKKATSALDEASAPLAEIMMDEVMEAMLRRQGLI